MPVTTQPKVPIPPKAPIKDKGASIAKQQVKAPAVKNPAMRKK